jgi:uncharacterized protein
VWAERTVSSPGGSSCRSATSPEPAQLGKIDSVKRIRRWEANQHGCKSPVILSADCRIQSLQSAGSTSVEEVRVAYRPRSVDQELREALTATGCVVLEGPKAVGKTETARQLAGSAVLLDIDENARRLAAVDPGLLLEGRPPRLLDEWQLEPTLWNHVRREVDRRGVPGQFILTGSAVPAEDVARHTGAGRMTRLRMRPMSLLETGDSSGEQSLAGLLDGAVARAGDTGMTIARIIDLICVGGWPAVALLASQPAQRAMRAYLTETARTDIRRVDGVHRDPVRVERVLRSLARNCATPASLQTLAADAGGADGPLDSETVRQYLHSLERLMIVEDLPPWAPSLRSRARLRTAPVRHFVDPCLAVAALRASPAMLLADLELVGFLFESLVVRDLRIHLQRSGGRISHYRDSNGLEVDIILETEDGRWAGFEVKLGSGQIDAAAASLHRFASTVDTSRTGAPAFLAVVTATGYAYTRPDGVHILPVSTLGP